MMSNAKRKRKIIAGFFAGLLVVQNFYPVAAYALTSGPSQPEMQKFTPVGANDLVDLFSGDFKYDIPLVDVGGYPVNLTYHSGAGIEDEASWVGAGWSLNPGSINRTMRGLPDDFTGDNADGDPQDAVRTAQYQKAFKKIGGQLLLKPTIVGFDALKPSLRLDVHKDNYWGIGATIGAGVNYTLGLGGSSSLTAGLTVNSDNRDGVTVSPNLTLTANYDELKESNGGSLSGGFTYNTRHGLESVNLSQSFSHDGRDVDDIGNLTGSVNAGLGFASFDKFYTHTYTPTMTSNSTHTDGTFSLDLGPAIFGGYFGIGGSGYISTQKNIEPTSVLPAYGYMHYSAGTRNPSALLDFNREKDGVFNTYQPAIPVPVSTPDYFLATSQAGIQQFHPVYNGNYVIYDRSYTDKSNSTKLGLSLGFGAYFQAGAQLNLNSSQTITHEWTTNNDFVANLNLATSASADPRYENVYFKQAGEMGQISSDFYNAIGQADTKKVLTTSHAAGGPKALATMVTAANAAQSVTGPMIRAGRDIRTSTFSYLTARQATTYGLDKTINGTLRVDPTAGVQDPDFTCIRKAHHMSEITVTDNDGKRMVYGIPVYNTDQEEVSFSVKYPGSQPEGQTDLVTDRQAGLVGYTDGVENSKNNIQGRYNIYNRKSIPPFATSFLLTGILSPDYVDKTGDGISDDDPGTAIKFFHSKIGVYNWRAPFESGSANYNEGFLADHQDDKGSYVFGKKEIWYMDSIQTRTMVAVFVRSDRYDGLGVTGEVGGISTTLKLKKLDKIILYSRVDRHQNGPNATPIKVVNFEYDYSLFPFVPNNSGPDPNDPNAALDANQGKLTLKKVYFTFGKSSRGQTNPYTFTYDNSILIGNAGTWGLSTNAYEAQDKYTQRQTDRWGTYRQSYFTTSSHLFYNSDFPYATQPSLDDVYDVRKLADRFASKWQLTDITTPTGAAIHVEYESDDYSYVQDRNAMVMCSVVGVTASGGTDGLISAGKIYVKTPTTVSGADDFVHTYLTGSDGRPMTNFFYKMFTKLNNLYDQKNTSEYVYGYAEIDNQAGYDVSQIANRIIGIPVKKIDNKYNPISVAAWQLVQTDLPQFAYPNYDNSNVDNLSGDVVAAVKAIIQDFANMKELFESFNAMASAKHYADRIDPSRSVIRLNWPLGKPVGTGANKKSYGKLGGGSRVVRVEIKDNWITMTKQGGQQTPDAQTMTYGLEYDYTLKIDDQNTISTGVASYEPEIGNEENPFREPVPYTEKVEWSNDRYHYMEKPFGESYFPSPSVGYSQVKVTAYGTNSDDNTPHKNTGWTINQFYTARDFPTQVDYLPLEEDTYEYDLTLLLFGAKYTNRVSTSQGFKVTLNDMHGKQKSVQVYDNSGQKLSSVDYFYNVADDNAQRKQLNNTVLALGQDGRIPSAGTLIATDAEIVTDVRESKITSSGNSVDANAGTLPALFVPLPYAGAYFSSTSSLTGYNSIALMKVIRQYGLLKEVRTTKDGSTMTADNLLWDAVTGNVLLTRNQNEFEDYTYTLNYPAFRAYDGMGGAYENIGAVFGGFTAQSDGSVASYKDYLSPGDELVCIDPGVDKRGWVLLSGQTNPVLRFIDQDGNFITGSGNYMVVRSGRRNMLAVGAGNVVTMTNPLIQGADGYGLVANVDQRVLDSKAMTYKDEWGMPVPNVLVAPPPMVVDIQPDAGSFCDPKQQQTGCTTTYTNYNVSEDADVTTSCNPTTFSAKTGQRPVQGQVFPVPTRGYLNFGNKPADEFGFTIASVHLLLTPVTMTGANGAYVSRVTAFTQCPGVSWANKPTTTSVDRVTVGATSSITSIDLTTMFTDWYATAATGDQFGVELMLQNELSTANIEMTFQGATGNSQPVLEITYASTSAPQCASPVNHMLNPYYQGVKGNWRPQYNYAYHVTRSQIPGNANLDGGTNIRSNGFYNSYIPFWNYSLASSTSPATLQQIPGVQGSQGDVSDSRWVWSTQSVYYDLNGNEIETVDALKRYSAATFGYQRSLVTASGSNARHNEIAFDGFEDYFYQLPAAAIPCPRSDRQLDFGLPVESGGGVCNGGNCVVRTKAHTGNYSLNLGGTITIHPSFTDVDPPSQFIGFDAAGHAILLANEQANGFSPIWDVNNHGIIGKPYVLSFWVNDSLPAQKEVPNLKVFINGTDQQVDTKPLVTAVVEGWKQLSFTIPKGGDLNISIANNGGQGGPSIYLDDIRLLPFDGEMTSYVYDDQTLRLMATLDENNFALIYEYDREGTPIRHKKETEKGIMTIKENRQSLMTAQ